MDAEKMLACITSDADMSMRVASQKMGRHPTFLATLRQKGSVPRISTMAEIADVYGYDLLLRKRADGQEIVIDPPPTD